MEGPVYFPPTYRMVEGQAAYDLERQPAWCDRVLHSKVSVQRKSLSTCLYKALLQFDEAIALWTSSIPIIGQCVTLGRS